MAKRKRKTKGGLETTPTGGISRRQAIGGIGIIAGGIAAGMYASGLFQGPDNPESRDSDPDIIPLGPEFKLKVELDDESDPVEINGINEYGDVFIRAGVLTNILQISEAAVAEELGRTQGEIEFTKFEWNFPAEAAPEIALNLPNASNTPNYAYPTNQELNPFTVDMRLQIFRQYMADGMIQIKYDAADTDVIDYFEKAYGKYGMTTEVMKENSLEDVMAAIMTMAVAQEMVEGFYS